MFGFVASCPLWGVGRAFIVDRHAEPQVDKCNDSRLFVFMQNFGEVLCGTRRTPEV